jgi:hypothetical protein
MAERRIDKSQYDEDIHCEEIDHTELEIVQVRQKGEKHEPDRGNQFSLFFAADREGKFRVSVPSDMARECRGGEGVVGTHRQGSIGGGEREQISFDLHRHFHENLFRFDISAEFATKTSFSCTRRR